MASLQKWAVYLCLFAVGIYFLKQYMQGPMCTSTARIDNKVVIVTGANTGIGKYTVLDLNRRGGKVYMACRSPSRCDAAAADLAAESGVGRERLITMTLDLASLTSVRKFAADFKQREEKLDILINNAGVMWVPYSHTEDGFETTLGVNHLGHFLLTQLLLDPLQAAAPSRVVIVSSKAHERGEMKFDDLMGEKEFGVMSSYSHSKLANVLFARELAKRLEGSGITTYSLHPGVIKTELTRYAWFLQNPIASALFWPIAKDIPHGAQTQICCAVNPALADQSGLYYSDCTEKAPIAAALSDEDGKTLWDMSVDLVKLQPEEASKALKNY